MMFDGIGRMLTALLWICLFAVPLGLWKLVEIVVWCCQHIRVE